MASQYMEPVDVIIEQHATTSIIATRLVSLSITYYCEVGKADMHYGIRSRNQDAAVVAMRKNRFSTSGDRSENGTKVSKPGPLIHSWYPNAWSESIMDLTEPPNFSSPHPTCISKKQSGR